MKLTRIIRNILISIVLLFLCILIYSEKWFLATWDSSVEFSTVVYQLFSPLKGTGKEMIQSYFEKCICPTLLIGATCVVFYYGLYFVKRNIILCWEIEFHGKKYNGNTIACKVFPCFILLATLCVMCNIAWTQAVEMEAIDYLEQISKRSTLFEEEYINPNNISISFPEKKRNLILIYLESMETTYASMDVGGGKPENYIPELTELAFDNLFFSDDGDFGGAYDSNGTGWTMAALLASSTGVPYKLGINGNDAGQYTRFLPGLPSLGDILQENGYCNYFMCGSDISFAGRDMFYQQHGNYTIIDWNMAKEEGFVQQDYDNGFWGLEDEKLLSYAKEKLAYIAALDMPFNFTLLTVDTHHPNGYICNLCEGQYNQQYANVLACSSKQIKAFIEWIQRQEWYENTTVVILGDHLSHKPDFWEDIGNYDRKIYNCFINLPEDIRPVKTQNRIFTTLDFFPSILAAMDAEIEGERLGLGTNLFSGEATLPERIGFRKFDEELGLYSNYYFQHFIMAK